MKKTIIGFVLGVVTLMTIMVLVNICTELKEGGTITKSVGSFIKYGLVVSEEEKLEWVEEMLCTMEDELSEEALEEASEKMREDVVTGIDYTSFAVGDDNYNHRIDIRYTFD